MYQIPHGPFSVSTEDQIAPPGSGAEKRLDHFGKNAALFSILVQTLTQAARGQPINPSLAVKKRYLDLAVTFTNNSIRDQSLYLQVCS